MAVNQLQTREQNPKHEKEVRFDIVQLSCVDLLSSHVLGTNACCLAFDLEELSSFVLRLEIGR